MLILEKVRWKNFLSFGNIFTEYDFNHPLTVIKGSNYAGKCLDPRTVIEVKFEDIEFWRLLHERDNTYHYLLLEHGEVTCFLIDVYNYYKAFPEKIGTLKVKTRFGFKTIEQCDITAFNSDVYKVATKDSGILTSPDHLLFTRDGWTKVKNLSVDDELLAEWGYEQIHSVSQMSYKLDLYDLQVEEVKEFYANGFVSHNSTILDVITFALYSKSYRQIPKPLLINCINKRDLLVEMEFTSYNHKFLVRRGLKPNIFEYYKDGILIEQDAKAKDYQKQFEEEALKINYEIFTQLVIVGKSNYTQFMKLPLGSRRLLIEQLLDLNIFSTMKTILSDKQSTVTKELKELQNEKSVLDKNKTILQNLLHEEQSSKIESIDHFDIDIEKNKTRILELESVNKTLSDENQNLLTRVKDNTKLKQDREKHNTLSTQLKVKSSSVLKEINFFKNNDSCPSCSQTISHLRDSKLPELEEKNSKLETAIKEVLNRYETTVKVIEENTSLIEKIQKNETIIRTNASIINEIKTNNKSLEIKKNSIQKFNEDKIISLQSQISKIDEDLEANRNLNKNFLQKKDHYDKIEPLLKDSGLKAIIVKKYIPIFNKLINHYLAKLGLYVRFELDEEFNEKILNRNLDNFVYNSFSEGQRQRIDLAMLLTWREITKLKNSIDCNLLIFDETLDSSLDQSGVDAFMDIMNNMKNVNIAIITHTPEKLKNSGRTLQYKLVGNFSQIKENVND